MGIKDIPLKSLDGTPTSLAAHTDRAVLVVNVASKCGLTPQYTALEELHKTYSGQGFSVVGFPCNQFGGQEPGTAEEIQSFCSTRRNCGSSSGMNSATPSPVTRCTARC